MRAGQLESVPELGTGYAAERTPSGRTWLRHGTVMLGYVEHDSRSEEWRAFRATGMPLKHEPRVSAAGTYRTRDLALADIADDYGRVVRARSARDGSAS
ncbi:hypothetical protein EBO15_24740 [Actinomadura harenae]|uniref:Uncharacterized protein n=1 Tax=Actinomadura harenae TaxID=2483351 RepID=A0A3M2LU63_9ACTN|nr:hypothetical protein EBO15_24740 [Actinomadura harenae]